jgi:hypothetical protein
VVEKFVRRALARGFQDVARADALVDVPEFAETAAKRSDRKSKPSRNPSATPRR